MATNKATHVIFDLDGTLLNTEDIYTEAFDEVTMKFAGKHYDMEVKQKMMGRPKQEGFKVYKAAYGITASDSEIEVVLNELLFKLFRTANFLPGAIELVEHFHRKGVPMAVATGSDRQAFAAKTSHCGDFFTKYFETVVLSCDAEVKKGKPSPDIFLVTAKRFKSPPENMASVLVIEDAANGVQAAINAGMMSLWVPCLPVDTSQLEANLVLDSLEDFKPEYFCLPEKE